MDGGKDVDSQGCLVAQGTELRGCDVEGHHEVRKGPRPSQPIPLRSCGLLSPLGPWRSPGRGHSASSQCFPGLCSLCPLTIDHAAPLPTARPGEAAVAGRIATFTRELQPLWLKSKPSAKRMPGPWGGGGRQHIQSQPSCACTRRSAVGWAMRGVLGQQESIRWTLSRGRCP